MAILAFREEGHHFWKTSTKSEKAAVMVSKEGWKDYRSGGPGGGESTGFKYCSLGGLQGKWKQRSLLWSIAKCLPGICLFNPLSKAISSLHAMWTKDPQLTGRVERWMQDTCGRQTHPPTLTTLLTCGNKRTNITNENTGRRTEDSWRDIFTQTYCFCRYKWLR